MKQKTVKQLAVEASKKPEKFSATYVIIAKAIKSHLLGKFIEEILLAEGVEDDYATMVSFETESTLNDIFVKKLVNAFIKNNQLTWMKDNGISVELTAVDVLDEICGHKLYGVYLVVTIL